MASESSSYTLYGTEFSLYTGKARAYLRYKGLPFRERLSTLRVYKRVIVPNTGVAFVPVVETPQGQFIQDTTEIIDYIESREPAPAVYPPTPRQRLTALLLELYADEWLLIPAMHYRWNFPRENEKFLMAEFGRVALPHAPAFIRRLVARRNAARFAAMLPSLGIQPETIPAIEQSYEALLDDLETHFSQHRYALGDRASLADFGLIAPFYAHLYRDPFPGALMRRRAPAVARWVERMFEYNPPHGQWMDNDAIPETLLPILRRQFTEHFPVLRDTVAAVASWVQAHPGQRLPRRIGDHRFVLNDTESERALMPYPQWMLQRPLDYYAELESTDRTSVDSLLRETGGIEAMSLRVPVRLRRENNRLWPEPSSSEGTLSDA
ncbi:MAG: glutathione S-transferase [Salinisphaera sp.]|uniref:glutathione S-transferase family protein n=1 Tax=Salinisphaera sp. TaxID=1914330 RepID=UPI003C7CF777